MTEERGLHVNQNEACGLVGVGNDQVKADDRFVSLYEAEYGALLRATYLLSLDRHLQRTQRRKRLRALERWSRLRDHDWAAGWVMTTALNYVRRAKRFRELQHRLQSSPLSISMKGKTYGVESVPCPGAKGKWSSFIM